MVMENEPFPILPPTFSGNSRSVDVGNVFDWLRQGWATFIVNPGTWIAMMVITIVIFIGLAIVPLIGQLAAHLLTPVLAAGMLVACRKVASEETLEIADLFAGFQRNTGPLMMLGVLYMIGMLLVSLLVLALAGGGLAGGLMMGSPVGASIAVGGFLVGAMLWLALSVPIAMAIWFAPALVLFNDMPPVDALKIIELVQKNRHIRLAGNDKLRIERALPEASARAQQVRDVLRALGTPKSADAAIAQ